MCTNFAFAPLVYFFYPETARMTLEEIDFLFTNPDKGPVKLSKEVAKEKKKNGHVSIVADTAGMRRMKMEGEAGQNKIDIAEHIEDS